MPGRKIGDLNTIVIVGRKLLQISGCKQNPFIIDQGNSFLGVVKHFAFLFCQVAFFQQNNLTDPNSKDRKCCRAENSQPDFVLNTLHIYSLRPR